MSLCFQSSALPGGASAPEQKYKEFDRLMDANKLEDARKQALERIKRYPDDYLGFRDLARISFEKGKYDEALGYFDQALKVNPGIADLHLWKANCYVRKEEYTKGRVEINKALSMDAKIGYAYCLKSRIDLDERKWQSCISNASQALKFDPNDSDSLGNRGSALAHLNRLDEALKDLNRAVELAPGNAISYNNRGMLYCEMNRFRDALVDLNKAIALNPKLLASYETRCKVLKQLHRYNEALADANHAIELGHGKKANSFCHRAATYLHLNRYQEAIADCNKAMTLDPTISGAWQIRGKCELELNQLDKALRDTNKAIELNPLDEPAHYVKGEILAKLGKDDEAMASLEKAMSLRNDSSTLKLHARFAAKQGYYEQAMDDLAPVSKRTMIKSGTVGETKNITALYTRLISKSPKNSSLFYDRAVAYLVGNQPLDALKDLLTYLNMASYSGKAAPQAVSLAVVTYRRLLIENKTALEQFVKPPYNIKNDREIIDRFLRTLKTGSAKPAVIAYLLGEVDDRNLIMKAKDNDQKTINACIVGLDLVYGKNRKKGLSVLGLVKDNGSLKLDEYVLALSELNRLSGKSH
ncbi:MAG: tetratricopeptide repeat protein [Candidatus Melainabacteria bacterium]|nr:tetratricopeptide repeat protein [Candidatus Melainabacteria bacterium]